MQSIAELVAWLVILPLPVASISWTVTHEELFRELRELCSRRMAASDSMVVRKFFYVLTCEYCFSHYVTAATIAVTGYRLLLDDWRGVLIAFFAVNAIANLYMSLFGRLRVEIKAERVEIASMERNQGKRDRAGRDHVA